MAPSFKNTLVMSVALHGVPPEAMQDEHVTACGRPILRQALEWAHLWDKQSQHALEQDGDFPVVDLLAELLIEMTRRADPLVTGFGNLGDDEMPRSYPTYLAFGLTARGWEHANTLFQRYPHYRSPARRTGQS